MLKRQVRGVVKEWGENRASKKKEYTILQLHEHTEKYIFFNEPEKLNAMKNKFPAGTAIEFQQEKKNESDKYWDYVKGTLAEYKKIQTSIPRDKLMIIRQNAGSHATRMIGILSQEEHLEGKTPKDIIKMFFEFAEDFVKWVTKD